jgi:hypothetical protein
MPREPASKPIPTTEAAFPQATVDTINITVDQPITSA